MMSRDWLKKAANAEDRFRSISAGGLAFDTGMLPMRVPKTLLAFGKLVELTRRSKGVSLPKLAEETSIDTSELLAIEKGIGWTPEPRTVYLLSKWLRLPIEDLQVLSGLSKERDQSLDDEAIRFAASSETTAELTEEERRALEGFVRILAKRAKEAKHT